MTESDCGNLWLVPGSHRRSPTELFGRENGSDLEVAVELKLPIGLAVLWRTALWHFVGPNLSRKTRMIMHVGYHYRWLRPTDFDVHDPALIERSSPIRRQLLGAWLQRANRWGRRRTSILHRGISSRTTRTTFPFENGRMRWILVKSFILYSYCKYEHWHENLVISLWLAYLVGRLVQHA